MNAIIYIIQIIDRENDLALSVQRNSDLNVLVNVCVSQIHVRTHEVGCD